MPEAFLSVATYDQAERDGRDLLPNRAIQASNTDSFNRVGFPHRCSSDGGIWRFAETMHEYSHKWQWQKYLRGLTENEATALKELNFDVLPELSRKYLRPVRVGNSFLCPLILARQVMAMFPGRKLRVLEIGAGSGYLSWFLARAGHKVITVDVAQGFYLFQNHLLRQSLGNGLVEMVTDERSISDCLADETIRAVHLPWWKYCDLYREEPDWTVDVVFSEANLCEMSAHGHKYAINLAKAVLDPQNPFSFLGFLIWGYQENVRHFDVFDAFRSAGFAMRHTDERLTVMAPCNEQEPVDRNLQMLVEHYKETKRNWREMLMLPSSFAQPTPEWTQFIQKARAVAQADVAISAEQVMANCEEEFGMFLPGGEDQAFARFIGAG